MKLLICALLVSVVAATCWARPCNADAAPPMPDISKGWKFHQGDDPAWAAPDYDDSQWRAIKVGKPWEQQGMEGYDGYGWYRLRFRVPSALKDDTDFKAYKALRVSLGMIDDVDRTWCNGKIIGETGTFPDAYESAWGEARVYTIPADLIRWDEENVLAVRVFDHDGDGGMYSGDYTLKAESWRDHVTMEIDLGHGDGVFFDKQGLPIAVTVSNGAAHKLEGHLEWKVASDKILTDPGAVLAQEAQALSVRAGLSKRFTCGFSPTTPGFYQANCTFKSPDGSTLMSITKFLGYRPEEIEVPLTRQPDFDAFWKNTLDELATVDPQFEMIPKPELDTPTHTVYEVKMRSFGNIRVAGWYEKPKTPGPHPALLGVPGYTSAMTPTKTSDPIAVFSFNIRAHGNSQEDVPGEPQDYWTRGLDAKEDYYYRGAFADCIRAVDFLASRPEVDMKRVAVTGGSQGGGLALVTAALDKRISFCAPDIPFMCNYVRYFKTSYWPDMIDWVKAKPHRSWDKTLKTFSYFDVLNFSDHITTPVFLGLGLQDDTCPPATIFAVYNRLNVPKEYHVYPHAVHWVGKGHEEKQRAWLLKHFQLAE